MTRMVGTSSRHLPRSTAQPSPHSDDELQSVEAQTPRGSARRRIALSTAAGLIATVALLAAVGRDAGEMSAAGSTDVSVGDQTGDLAAWSRAAEHALSSTDAAAAPVGSSSSARSRESLLQDAEFVYGPLVGGFDADAFMRGTGDPLAERVETFRGRERSAGEIVQLVGREHSVSPRLLLALLYIGGPDAVAPAELPPDASFAASVERAAAWLSDGYYGFKHRNERDVWFANGASAQGPLDSGAAHFAVARYLALDTLPDEWPQRLDWFARTYDELFGSAPLEAASAHGPTTQPPLLLPWAKGETWHFTGGPHGGWGAATAWAAVDFAPPSPVGCGTAPEWVLASAPGVVTFSESGLVLLDLDGDGDEGTGWVLSYLHIASEDRVEAGARLETGDRIGHASCEGGRSSGAHVHLARRYDGEWIPAGEGPAPLVISGWAFASGDREYEGLMQHPSDGTRSAVASATSGRTDLTSDNVPTTGAVAAVAAAEPGDSAPAHILAAAGSSVQAGGTLVVRLELDSRTNHATPFVLGIARGDEPTIVLMGRTDESGRSEAITLPPMPDGRYAATLRAPGFLPARALEIDYGPGPTHVVLDLTGGGMTPLRGGELTSDDAVDGADVRAWVVAWLLGRGAADVDGDGRAALDDLRLVLGSRGMGASRGG